ncbi:G5 domain-containing protein [Microbacterium sp. Clip185]|uniref:G5 domain-containing protein n=1 Tax=Microbacterium sp. Clip185 TaxID=3025663 RepID=UPI0023673B4A|nr:G5 domain-containing protein [Microbacterium sp. Clip185]WDG18342.1 G5 domain-containing protein [Microbacterium sp. Clip185]
MANEAGWFPDPKNGNQWRWWDGRQWTDRVAPTGSPAAPKRDASRSWLGVPVWGWVLVAAALVTLTVVVPWLVALGALSVLVTGIVAIAAGTPTWLRLRTRRMAVAVAGGAAVLVLVTGTVAAATSVGRSVEVSTVGAASSASPTPEHTTTRAPSPTPTPVTTTRDESVTEAIPFERTTGEDPSLTRGETRVSVAGADGELTRTFRVTLVDGVEVKREQIAETVTRAPVTEVTVVGTYDPPAAAPAPAAPAPAQGGCDPNYADGCVPIASDVDCAGGSGNGPAYFSGTARVVGSDIYDLDRDGDGIACDS